MRSLFYSSPPVVLVHSSSLQHFFRRLMTRIVMQSFQRHFVGGRSFFLKKLSVSPHAPFLIRLQLCCVALFVGPTNQLLTVCGLFSRQIASLVVFDCMGASQCFWGNFLKGQQERIFTHELSCEARTDSLKSSGLSSQ